MTLSTRTGSLFLVALVVGILFAAAGCTCQRPRSTSAPGIAPAAPPGAAPPAAPKAALPATVPSGSAPAVSPSGTIGTIAPTPLTACGADSDCVAVAGDCCGCFAGGSQGVVTRAKLDEFEAARAKRCTEAVCVTLMSSHPSCSLKARCVNGSCRLVPPPASPPDSGASPPDSAVAPPEALPGEGPP
jgi:hypothetical protein